MNDAPCSIPEKQEKKDRVNIARSPSFNSNFQNHNMSIVSSFTPSEYIINNALRQFIDAASQRGLILDNPIADGEHHRCPVVGKSKNSKDGDYKLHLDGVPAGGFQNHCDGLGWQNWKADIGRKLTHQEIIAQQARIDEARRQREIELQSRHEEAAAKAVHLWSCARPASNHPYLAKKKIQAHRARQIKTALIIPLYDASNRLANIQFISPEGDKRFLSGGRKQGCFFFIGERTDPILICEGFATGASLHEKTGKRVVVAFDAGNLLPVARNIRELAPDSEIIVSGDSDTSGVGQQAANEAALAVNGKVLIPPIAGMDWNDYLNAGGENT